MGNLLQAPRVRDGCAGYHGGDGIHRSDHWLDSVPSDHDSREKSPRLRNSSASRRPAAPTELSDLIDTHCHLTFHHFTDRVDALLDDARAAGVSGFISVSTTTADACRALAIAESHDDVWCSAGIHPLYADEPAADARIWSDMRRVAESSRCVAWGELGLDQHYDTPTQPTQHQLLEEQLAFIESCHSDGIVHPVIVHCRKAFDELIPIFNASTLDPSRFVFHCFTGTPEDARKVLDFGSWISLTGIVTFRNAREIAEASDLIPDDRIMVETDAPYLSPEPMRKVFPNVPAHVTHTARFLAERRGQSFEDFESMVDDNAERFFGVRTPHNQ